ncbi:MAG: membrane protein insertase YidC [Pseudomonadota bacterium]
MNQQPAGDEQRNLLLAGVLCCAVFFLYTSFVLEPREQERLRVAEEQRAAQTVPGAQAPVGAPGNAPFGAQPLDRETALAQSARIQIETPRLTGSIALKGGLIDELSLKGYRVTLNPESPLVELLWPAGSAQAYLAKFGWSAVGGLKTPGPQAEWSLAPGSPDTLGPESPVTLTWSDDPSEPTLVFTRTIAIDENYLFTVTQTVENRSDAEVRLRAIGRLERRGIPELQGFFVLHEGPVAAFNGVVEEVDYSDLADAPKLPERGRGFAYSAEGPSWLGFTDKYWMTALAPADGGRFDAVFEREETADGTPLFHADVIYPTVAVPPSDSASVTTRLFAGAKEIGVIREYEYLFDGRDRPEGFFGRMSDFLFASSASRFVDAIDWGWFFFLTKPIAEILFAINGAVGNMGVAIIVLTIIFKLLVFPLAYKSYVSMSKLKKLQPKMKEIQERAGDDRMKMQQEMMELYKKERVNPAAGCLPILLQIPIFFSLYKVLFVTIEMRHAPFFGWIQDLSAPDPTSFWNLFGLLPYDPALYLPQLLLIGVWPVLMGITMWLQQMLNPAPTDPVQERIFNMLPLLFTFMLGTFASGLVIYWTANNLFTIIQQYWIMRNQGVDVDLLGNIRRQFGLAPKEERSG